MVMRTKVIAAALAAVMAAGLMPSGAMAQEAEVLALINKERAKGGCGPLKLNAQLTAAAKGHAEAMGKQNFFSHTGKNGSTLRSRLAAAGYRGGAVAENIAAGGATPEKAVAQWMASSGHRKNILTCKYSETGIGMYYDPKDAPLPGQKYAMKYYWVQTFGKP
jgi:uncharacterized protein YkwD